MLLIENWLCNSLKYKTVSRKYLNTEINARLSLFFLANVYSLQSFTICMPWMISYIIDMCYFESISFNTLLSVKGTINTLYNRYIWHIQMAKQIIMSINKSVDAKRAGMWKWIMFLPIAIQHVIICRKDVLSKTKYIYFIYKRNIIW